MKEEHDDRHQCARNYEQFHQRRSDVVFVVDADQQLGDKTDRDAHGADQNRIQQCVGVVGEGDGADHHRRASALSAGAEQVGAHTGDIAHIVAHVVGDHRRIARIVLGDALFHLADQIGADIGRLGEDAAAHAREQCNGRSAKAESGNDFHQDVIVFRSESRHRGAKHEIDHHQAQGRQSDQGKAHDGAGIDRHIVCVRDAFPG